MVWFVSWCGSWCCAVRLDTSADTFSIRRNSSSKVTVSPAGNVGIGTTSPGSALDVNGAITARGDGSQVSLYLGPGSQSIRDLGTASITYLDLATGSASHGQFIVRSSNAYTERARIDTSGRLLVGTSSARSNFYNTTTTAAAQIEGTTGDTASLAIIADRSGSPSRLILASTGGSTIGSNTIVSSGNGAGSISFQASDGTEFIQVAEINADIDGTPGANDMPGRLTFSTTADGASSPTERMRISQNGTISLGTAGAINTTLYVEAGTDAITTLLRNANSGSNVTAIGFRNSGGSYVGAIYCNNTNTTYSTTSDYRLKENVEPITGAAARILQLKPSRFNFTANPDQTVDGFLAHEVQDVVPEAITNEKDAVDEDGNPVYQGIDQSKLVPLLTAALQEAIGEIESLKARLTAAGI